MKKKYIILFVLAFMLIAFDASSQCAMCTAVAEEAMKNGSSQGAGINKGVLYLFLTPYLIVGTIGIIWWRKKIKANAELQDNA